MSTKRVVERFRQLEVEFFRQHAATLNSFGITADDSYLYGEFAFLLLGLKPSVLIHFPPPVIVLYEQGVIEPVLKALPNISRRRIENMRSEEMDLTGCILLYHLHDSHRVSNLLDEKSRVTESQLAEILDYPGSLPNSLEDVAAMKEVAYIDADRQTLLTTYAALDNQLHNVKDHFERHGADGGLSTLARELLAPRKRHRQTEFVSILALTTMIGATRRLLSKSLLSPCGNLATPARMYKLSAGTVRMSAWSSSSYGSLGQNATRAAGTGLFMNTSVRRYTTETATEPIKVEGIRSSAQEALEQVAQAPTATDGLVEAAAQIGDFKAMGLCNFTPVGGLEAMLEAIHVYSGLPWWGTIALATVTVRLALLPVMVKIQRNNAKLMNINPEVTRIMDNLKTAQAQGDTHSISKYSAEIQTLFKSNGCHPLKSLGLPLVQMPVMVSFFLALRGMAELPVPGLQNGGMWWFQDLTAQDPYYILPVVSAAGMMAVLEAGTEAGMANPQSKSMKNFFRAITVIMVPFTAWMPSSVFVYWATSNVFSIGQILALKNPTIRKALNIPPLVRPVSELSKNTKGFMENFRDQQKQYEKMEKERAIRERQQAAAMARRAAKRRF
ncbi:Mitochondrial inner membrane protein oxa1l [Apophysomyces ossiformis]|uniref:Mitochondrial inner membrane protein oxa1l n=1 Tax=Apophysomyces ossiformis TaxID=679940 RepID=A0A8H7EUD2_9FUNG|nr:Mitochondrial inner membrane protein oxa1l [Apophysomyces ossiformis]